MFKGLVARAISIALIPFNSIFCFSSAHAQLSNPDTVFVSHAVDHAKRLYDSSIRAQSNLNNGSEYVEYDPRQDEHPYFLSDDWEMGTIVYDNDRFEDVPLLYDISQQKVVTEHSSSANKIALVSNKISSFTVLHHTFIRIEEKTGERSFISTGFYDLLYDGKIKVLARREKQLQERVLSGELEAKFEESNRYYIHKDKTYFQVKSKRSVITVLADKKRSVKQFANKNKINFHLHREEALVRMAEFYDSLKN